MGNIVRCSVMGHFYDSNKYASCPHCKNRDDAKNTLSTIDLKLIEDNILYFSQYQKAAEWKGGEKDGVIQFAYPVYPEGMRLYELLEALGGDVSDYKTQMDMIEQAGLLPSQLNDFQIRVYITCIVRGEKFCDGHIEQFMKNHTLLKLCLRLDDLVVAARRMQVLIGRDPNCDLCIEEKIVSRKHASVYCDGKQWFIRDLDSSNGTMLNGKKILISALTDEDRIQIGECVIIFQRDFLILEYNGEVQKYFLQMPLSKVVLQTMSREKSLENNNMNNSEEWNDYDRRLNFKDVNWVSMPKDKITVNEKLNVGDVVRLKNYKYEIQIEFIDYSLSNDAMVDYAGTISGVFWKAKKLYLFNQKDIECIVKRAGDT